MAGPFQYSLFGLRLQSEIELPELPTSGSGGPPDVEITRGSIPNIGKRTTDYQVDDDGAGFGIEDVAAYWVSEGRRILVDPHPNAPARNVRLYLLGSAMGILLHQRGLLPLHANAIDVGGFAIAFLGHSGAGKSTLAAAFHDAGYRVLTDDVSVVRTSGETPIVFPGIPRLRLTEQMVEASGRDSRDLELSYEGDEGFRKFDVKIEAGSEALPLRSIYRLAVGPLALERLSGARAVEALIANTYRGEFIRAGGLPAVHWGSCVELTKKVAVFDFCRERELDRLRGQIETIVRHAKQSVVSQSS